MGASVPLFPNASLDFCNTAILGETVDSHNDRLWNVRNRSASGHTLQGSIVFGTRKDWQCKAMLGDLARLGKPDSFTLLVSEAVL